MGFVFKQKVLFKHCDPAGIVFYPRYFEMMNDCVEAFFASELNWPFEKMHPENGVPTVSISTQFMAPSRHGDILELEMNATRLGKTSLDFLTIADCDGERRFETQSTIVKTGRNGNPSEWPDGIRAKLQEIMESQYVT